MKKITFSKPGTMLYPVPSVMVSCGETPEEHNIITIAWTGTVNSDPPMVYISVRKSRHSHSIISRTGEFVINLPTEEMVPAMDRCGVRSGKEENKFKVNGLTPVPASKVKCPMIDEAPVNLECRVKKTMELPSHDMFIAEVVAVHASEALLNTKGRLKMEDAGLVTFCHGAYYGVRKRPLGILGFSVMKKRTKKKLHQERRGGKPQKTK